MSDAAREADASLVAALARGAAKAVASLLDEQFNWIDGSGRVLTRDQIAGMKPLLGDEKGFKPIVHSYGDVVSVVVEGDKRYLLRIWGKRPAGWDLDRDPYLLETNVPGVFAVGDVRDGAIRRVANSVGEGSIVLYFIRQYMRNR